ncbi:MAG: nucleotidyltransferase family protein [Rubrobacteridae bacterium]|nr:nucleotidyltransferase family protein [Rubrobacteridae bacterium]
MVDAIVLGGGNAKGLAQVPAKGLVPIDGRPMVDYVLNALIGCSDVDRICVVLPVEHAFIDFTKKIDTVVASGSLPAVAKAGFDFIGAKNKTLVLSADVPMISPESISDFLNRCRETEASFYYPIVRYGESEKLYPNVKRTYAKVKDGRFTGGNIALVEPAFVYKNVAVIERLYELRKKPVKIARFLGIGFLIKFVLGMLSIRDIEERVGEITSMKCTGIVTPYPEIGIDVDKDSDLRLATQAIAGRA